MQPPAATDGSRSFTSRYFLRHWVFLNGLNHPTFITTSNKVFFPSFSSYSSKMSQIKSKNLTTQHRSRDRTTWRGARNDRSSLRRVRHKAAQLRLTQPVADPPAQSYPLPPSLPLPTLLLPRSLPLDLPSPSPLPSFYSTYLLPPSPTSTPPNSPQPTQHSNIYQVPIPPFLPPPLQNPQPLSLCQNNNRLRRPRLNTSNRLFQTRIKVHSQGLHPPFPRPHSSLSGRRRRSHTPCCSPGHLHPTIGTAGPCSPASREGRRLLRLEMI